jgi:hypothetical protein
MREPHVELWGYRLDRSRGSLSRGRCISETEPTPGLEPETYCLRLKKLFPKSEQERWRSVLNTEECKKLEQARQGKVLVSDDTIAHWRSLMCSPR